MTNRKTPMHDDIPPAGSGQALLEALRSNLGLLSELAVRYQVDTRPAHQDDAPAINRPEDVHRLLGPEMTPLAQEQLRVLLLDVKNRVMGQRVVYQGNVNSVMVRPAEVLRPAVAESAPHFVLVHNHPSGDPTPSYQDRALTGDLYRAAKLLDIDLLDHVVVGHGGFASLKEQGCLPA